MSTLLNNKQLNSVIVRLTMIPDVIKFNHFKKLDKSLQLVL